MVVLFSCCGSIVINSLVLWVLMWFIMFLSFVFQVTAWQFIFRILFLVLLTMRIWRRERANQSFVFLLHWNSCKVLPNIPSRRKTVPSSVGELPVINFGDILRGNFAPWMTVLNQLIKPKGIQNMNRKPILALVLVVTVAFASTVTAEEPWFDLDKCAFCKEFAKQPGLVEHMKTEYHNTKNGIISVTYVDKAYQPAMEKAHAGIAQVVADKVAGKPIV